MKVVNVRRPATSIWSNIECSNNPKSNDATDLGLADVIKNMVYLSEKIDVFCVRFENARRRPSIQLSRTIERN